MYFDLSPLAIAFSWKGINLTKQAELRLLPRHPVVEFLARSIFCHAIAFLDLALELLALAVDLVDVIIRKLTPLLLDLAFELLPISFDTVPIHHRLLMVTVRQISLPLRS